MHDGDASSSNHATATAAARRASAPQRIALRLRRLTMLLAVVAASWFVLRFDTYQVGARIATHDEIPPGSWLILDSWSRGLRVGSDVVVVTPFGELVSRVSALDDDAVFVDHPCQAPNYPDSDGFGALPRDRVRGVVVVTFRPEQPDVADGGR